jgi:hypothetical protein
MPFVQLDSISQYGQTLSLPSYYYRAHSLEDVASKDTNHVDRRCIVRLCLPPSLSVHKPSYMTDLYTVFIRTEKRELIVFALVISTVASSLVQLPRSYLPIQYVNRVNLPRSQSSYFGRVL